MNTITVRASAVALAILVAGGLSRPAAGGPAEEYLNAQLRVVQALAAESTLDALADAADASVDRLLAGGNLYLAGEPGMVSEVLGRAGGLCGAKPLPADVAGLKAHDVVVGSDYAFAGPASYAGWDKLLASPALVIAFAPAQNPLSKRKADRLRAFSVQVPDGQRAAVAPAIAVAQWTYIAELVAAGRRHNRQLAVYLSIFLDEGRLRYQRTTGLMFEPELRPEPVPRRQYGAQFLGAVRTALEAVRGEELDKLKQAARWLTEARSANRKTIRNLPGHLPPYEVGHSGDAAIFTNAKPLTATGEEGRRWIRENLGAGDVYLLVGYQQNEDDFAAAANALGVRTIFFTSKGPGAAQAQNPRHLYINPHWPYTDACLELPGYDVKACPLSAILGLSCYFAICAEASASR